MRTSPASVAFSSRISWKRTQPSGRSPGFRPSAALRCAPGEALGGWVKGLLLIPALVAAVVVYAVFDTDSGIQTLWKIRATVADSRARVAAIEREIAALRREAATLENDPFAIETAIRSDLGLVRPGERVVRLPGSKHSNPRFP